MNFDNVTLVGGIELQVAFAPDAPTIGTATAWETAATITFTAPSYTGSTSIISYTATSNPDNITNTVYQSGSGAVTVTGLSPSTSYTFTITATNSNGTSLPSGASNSITTVPASVSLYSFGVNDQGQLGQNDLVYRSSPVQVGSASTWNYLASGRGHILATKRDGTLWGWGRGNNGQLGNNDSGATAPRSSPTQVGALTNWSVITAGNYASFGIKTDGTLWAWGSNTNGQLGINTVVAKSSPVIVGSDTDWADLVSGDDFIFALKTNGTLWCWGLNTNGQLGLNDITNRSNPVQLGADTNWRTIGIGANYTLATKTDGTLWAWGDQSSYVGYYGVLGLNDLISRSSPTQVGTLTNWSILGKGGYTNTTSFAIKTNGTLWAWGYNGDGRVGINIGSSAGNRSSPVQIGSDTKWISVASGNATAASGPAAAIKTDGTLWTWAYNTKGSLGLNDISPRSSPTQVGTGTDWIGSPAAGFGGGTVAIGGTLTVPSAPIIRTVYLLSSTSVAIEYLAPITDGGSPITSYTAISAPGYIQSTVSRPNGGTIIISGLTPDTSYTFTVTATNSSGTSAFSTASSSITTTLTAPSTVDFLVVAGGGGAGRSGGGGAGGFRTSVGTSGGGASAESSATITSGVTYTITVGAGGAGGVNGVKGSNSVFSSITSIGGGIGAGTGSQLNGGSGGGAYGQGSTPSSGGTGTANQGYAGGSAAYWGAGIIPGGGGGGGGAGSVGTNADNGSSGQPTAGAGGIGVQNSITGQTAYYAGGGGGGSVYTYTGALGGRGGGGAGGGGSGTSGTGINNPNGENGWDNTGGGAGGGRQYDSSYGNSGAGGAGGSGVVVLRFPSTNTPTSVTGSPNITISGSYKIYKWFSSGSITF